MVEIINDLTGMRIQLKGLEVIKMKINKRAITTKLCNNNA
jgi:hypothetical protein